MFAAGLAAVLALAFAPAHPSVAQGSADDYFVAAFGDPMDFSNAEDLVINTNEAMFTGNAANKSISGGQLHFDSVGATTFDPVWAGAAAGIPHGREGGRVPIDTSRYGRLVIRMNAPEGVASAATWFSCREQTQACQGGTAFTTHAGWNTYDLPLSNTMGLPAAWSGAMVGLRLILNGPGHFDVDWIRLAPAGSGDVQEIVGGPTVDLVPTGKLDYATAGGNAWDMDAPGDVRQLSGLRAGATFSGNMVSACTVGTASGQFPGLVMSLPAGPIDANRFTTLTFEYSYDGAFSTRPVAGGGLSPACSGPTRQAVTRPTRLRRIRTSTSWRSASTIRRQCSRGSKPETGRRPESRGVGRSTSSASTRTTQRTACAFASAASGSRPMNPRAPCSRRSQPRRYRARRRRL